MSILSLLLALLSLGAVLALVVLAGRLARAGGLAARISGAAGDGRLRLVQSLALDPRRRLHLVQCDGRCALLLTGGAQDVVVGWAAAPAEDGA
ncbi:MAG: flagellar biosynthetic protein FliO [Rhodospirillales bacterium]|nr:flagellar biosynthetic protein FliO [Rhodospirillales bacterium]MDE2200123.1 flagellar biosynthetic protein FliO [Rhodospirillales bacterium]MDE2574728.1 flagellar biosynthetic protein FliO [Rhodospirillales bacterium]